MQVFVFLLFCLHLALSSAYSAGISAPTCQDTTYGRICSLQGPVDTVSIIHNKLMLGSLNSLFSTSFELQVHEYADLTPKASVYENCVGFELPGQLGNDPSSCQNFVKLIQLVPAGDRILVCGTNAFRPKCTLHNVSNISVYEYMTDVQNVDNGFSPYSDNTQIVATLTSGERFFSGTRFNAFASQTIGMAPNPLQRDNTILVNVPSSDQRWLHEPTFVSSYETDSHVYFFLRERAYEVDQGKSVVYSRAVRICKSDNGMNPEAIYPTNFFLTFQKARMSCTSFATQGTIPYSYDNLQSTVFWVQPDGQQFLYGVFTSPVNAPSGSAICKFNFDPNSAGSLTKVFEDGQYLVSDGNPLTWRRVTADTFSCPGEGDNQRSISDASQYQLVFNDVTSMDSQPLHTVAGKRLDKLIVDIINYNQSTQTIMYYSTQNGDLHQLVIDDEGNRQEDVINRFGSALGHLTIRRNSDETRFLYATTDNHVMLISLGDCSKYDSCFACLDSKDAYCGWDGDRCTNKITSSPLTIIQSVLTIESRIIDTCGSRSDTTTPLTPSCQITTLDHEEEPGEISTTSVGSLSAMSDSSISIPDLVGATIGAFVVGIPVGAFVCFLFLKLFITPKKHKHSINHHRHSGQADARSNTITQVNNRITDDIQKQIQKKDLAMRDNPSYIPTIPSKIPSLQLKPTPLALAPPPSGNTHKRKNSKDINMYVSTEDDAFDECDVVPPLRSFNVAGSSHPHRGHKSIGHTTTNGVGRKKFPGYTAPRGRTDSTTWLRENSLSSEPSSPLDSPISDV
ncbi:semaphorin-5B-like [Halichondria panicea]|uniref:semaphorin-5B-like n=1 Tax=Halichondria panicea TaxID=6063 RepID=UPI00312B48EE